jgi:hypothetical protein
LSHDEGRREAKRFIARDGAAIGVRETLDIAKVFADSHAPKMKMPANEDAYDVRAAQG